MKESARIGFIGLGLMGKQMAGHIVRNGYPLTIMAHRNRAPLELLIREGAVEVATPAEMASQSDIVFICVATSEQVEEIVSGEQGLLSGGQKGLIIVDCSTVHPESTERLAEVASRHGIAFVDAPLARTPREAKEGRLNVMVGGEAQTLARIRPVIECFAENIFHVGKLGSAHKLKLINNFLSLGAATLVAEAAAMAARMEVDQHKLLEICAQGGANSAMLAPIMAWVLERDCSRLQFSLGNAEKDMRYLAETLAAYQAKACMLPALCEYLRLARDDLGPDAFVPQSYDASARRHGVEVPTEPLTSLGGN